MHFGKGNDVMPFCQNCGRPLNAGEVCQCAAQQGGTAPQSTPYMNQLNQPYQYQPGQQPPQKKGGVPTGCLIAAAIAIPIFLAIAGILAAILVPAMVGYTKKSKISAANTYARNVYRAANTVLVDMDEEDINVGGAYIISNYGLEPKPAFDGGAFFDEMKVYMGDSTADLEYFAVVEDGRVVYVAVKEIGNMYTGCYPNVSTTDGPVSITGEQYYEWDMARLEEDAQNEVRRYIESELDLDDAAYE